MDSSFRWNDKPGRTRRAALLRGIVFRAFALFVVCGILQLTGCAAPHRADPRYSPVILISFDGYRPDYLDRGFSPQLAALAADGVRATALKPSFPTLTFPNHYTIVTGLYPDHHGIVGNRIVDPQTGKHFVYNDAATIADPFWWGGEPLWVSVQRSGRQAATMFWPGSDVKIDGVRPGHWKPFDGTLSPDARVEQVLAWLDLPPGQRPDFVTLYFEQVDHASHTEGPASALVDSALGEVDHALARLVDGLKRRGLFESSNVVIVSDHGGTQSGPDHVVLLDSIVDLASIDIVNTGVLAEFKARPGHEAAVDDAVLKPHEHMRCWRKNDVPARLHYGTNPRIPPLLCLADNGWLIYTRQFMDNPNRHISRGEHGYDNDEPDMRALFVAHGPAFRRGMVVPEFENVDVYPLLAHILHIRPAANDGDFAAVKPMLAQP